MGVGGSHWDLGRPQRGLGVPQWGLEGLKDGPRKDADTFYGQSMSVCQRQVNVCNK